MLFFDNLDLRRAANARRAMQARPRQPRRLEHCALVAAQGSSPDRTITRGRIILHLHSVISERRIVRRLKIRAHSGPREWAAQSGPRNAHSWFGGDALRMSRIPRTDDAWSHGASNYANFLPAGKQSCPLLPSGKESCPRAKQSCPLVPSLCRPYTFHPKKCRPMFSPRFCQCDKRCYHSDGESNVHY